MRPHAKPDDLQAEMKGSEKEGLMAAHSQSPKQCPNSKATTDQEIGGIHTF